MKGKNIIFDDKKTKRVIFIKNKNLFNMHDVDVDKVFISKKNHMVKKAHLNTFLDTMMMISLDHYT